MITKVTAGYYMAGDYRIIQMRGVWRVFENGIAKDIFSTLAEAKSYVLVAA